MASGVSADQQASAPARTGLREIGSRRGQGLIVLGVVAGLAGVVALRDPHIPGSLGTCPSLLLFGVYCPGCGSLRGIHDLTHGAVLEAMGHNLLLIPALVFLIGWSVYQIARGSRAADSSTTWVATRPGDTQDPGWRPVHAHPFWAKLRLVLVVALPFIVIIFAVVRNLPGSALAP